MQQYSEKKYFFLLGLIIYISAAILSSFTIGNIGEVFYFFIFSYLYSSIPLLLYNNEPRVLNSSDFKPSRAIPILLLLLISSTFLKFYLRGYDIQLNPVIMRDQMLSYSRSPVDIMLGAFNSLLFGALLTSLLYLRFIRFHFNTNWIIFYCIVFSFYAWSGGSRLALVFFLALSIATGWRPKLNLKTVCLFLILGIISAWIFILRAERSGISMHEAVVNYAHWLQIAGGRELHYVHNDFYGAFLLVSMYIGHSFNTLILIIDNLHSSSHGTLGGVISLFLDRIGFNFDAASPFRGLMHTEIGYFVNEGGWLLAIVVLLVKLHIAFVKSRSFQLYILKLIIPMSLICSPFTSIINFSIFIPYFFAFLLSLALPPSWLIKSQQHDAKPSPVIPNEKSAAPVEPCT